MSPSIFKKYACIIIGVKKYKLHDIYEWNKEKNIIHVIYFWAKSRSLKIYRCATCPL